METQTRTIAKTISWRVFATLITSVLVWKLTGKAELGISIATLDCLIKLLTYYMHERAWNAVDFGYEYPQQSQSVKLELTGSGRPEARLTRALLLIDHGSVRNEANLLLEDLAALIQKMRPDLLVHVAHMEIAEPSIAQGFEKCVENGAKEVIVFPYMLGQGRHAHLDIPRFVKEVARKYSDVVFHVTEPLGLHEKIAQVVLERASL